MNTNLVNCGMGVYRLDVPIYDVSIFVAKNFEKIRPNAPEDKFINAFGLVWLEKNGIYMVLNNKHKYERQYLVHECVHLANKIYMTRGIKPDTENDESFAYLTEWIYGELEKFFFKK